MGRAYSQDLRDRVIDAAFSGKSARRSAAHFGIGVATAIVWIRRVREAGVRTARRQGGTKRCKLEPHREFLLGVIDETPDLTISELVERLLAARGVKVARSTLWAFLDRCGLTFKKSPRTLANRIAPTSPGDAKNGSKGSWISIPKSSSSSTKRGKDQHDAVARTRAPRASDFAPPSPMDTGKQRRSSEGCDCPG